MTRLSLWLIPLVGGVLFLLTGALGRPQPGPVPAPITDLGPLPSGKDARQLLDQAIATYLPQTVPWQRAQIWQRVVTDGGSHEVRGRYLTGPDYRLRLDLEVQVGKARADIQMIGDGQRLWLCQHSTGKEVVVTQTELPPPPKDIPNSAAYQAERVRELHEGSFGVSTLLTLLRDGGQGWQGKLGRWQGGEVLHLSAGWTSTPVKQEGWAEGLRPPPQARRVCVFLDAQTLWPQRIEWWGETADGTTLPMVEMEFRTPVLNQPLTAEECRREFTCVPG